MRRRQPGARPWWSRQCSPVSWSPEVSLRPDCTSNRDRRRQVGDDPIVQPTTPVPTSGMGVNDTAPPAISVSSCRLSGHGGTSLSVSGSIRNRSPETSDYRLVVDWFRGSAPVARSDISRTAVSPGLSARWSAVAAVAGETAGPVSCRSRSRDSDTHVPLTCARGQGLIGDGAPADRAGPSRGIAVAIAPSTLANTVSAPAAYSHVPGSPLLLWRALSVDGVRAVHRA